MSDVISLRPPSERRSTEFRLAGRVVQPHLNRVVSPGGATRQVEPKVMEVLLHLARRAGQVVTKDELLGTVWEGVFVTEDVLVRAVGELRKLFEDGDGPPAVIETIRKRGYRLIAPVVYELLDETLRGTTPPARPASPAEAPHPRAGARARRLTYVALGLAGATLAALLLVPGRRSTSSSPRFLPFTTLEGNEFDPAVSPDGTRVAFSWDGGKEGPTALYVKMVGSEDMLRLTGHDGSNRGASWSPDGSRLGYVRSAPGVCDIMTVSAVGGPPRRLAPCASARARFSWSPDGRWLAVSQATADSGPRGRIRLLALDSAEARDLTHGAGDFTDSLPAFAPDGRRVAFVRWLTDSVGDLHVAQVEGGAVERLTSDNADIMGYAWVDQGRRLLFSSNRAGMYSLWSVGRDGGEPQLVAGGGRKIKHPSASRAGDIVAYEAWEYEMNLAELRAPFDAYAPPRRLAPASDEWTFEPRLSPDRARIAFASTRSGSYEIWTARADGSSPVRLTSFGGPYVGLPRWSPDGRSLAFVARPSGQADVYVVDVAGGPPRPVTRDPADESAPSFSRDGTRLYFASHQKDGWQVRVLTLSSGVVEPRVPDGGFAALESRDGRWLYYSRNDRPGLWRMAARGGPATLVTAEARPEDTGCWGVLDGGVYWLDARDESAPAVVVADPGGGNRRRLAVVPEMAWPGVEVSPDATRVLYSRLGRHDSNIVLLSARRPLP